jgi:MFS family permease
LLATSIAVFNQLSGVNILLLYLLDVLASAGIGLSLSHIYTVAISCLGLAMTAIGMSCIDRLGRRPLLVLGAAGMGLCLAALGMTIPLHLTPLFYLFVLIAYNAFFAFSQGTVVWVYLSELFPPGVRGAGQGYGSSMHWVTNAILVGVFPLVERSSSAGIFFFFALMMVLQIVIVLRWYPETKGVAVGSITADDMNGWDRVSAGSAL